MQLFYEVGLFSSFLLNIGLLSIVYLRKPKAPPPPAAAQPTLDATQLMHDLTKSGGAVVRVIPLDPSQIFYRSPRG